MISTNSKIITALALIVGVVMIASPLAFIGGSDNADAPVLGDASTANGTYTIFVDNGNGWQSQVVYTYDGAQAVQATSFWKTGDSMVDRATTGAYPSLNATYGDITTFNGKTEDSTNVWNVFVYVDGEWTIGNDAIGFYRCFDDYASNWQTANIALQYGADATSVPTSLTSYITSKNISLSDVTEVMHGDANYMITFHLQKTYGSVEAVINGNVKDSSNQTITTQSLATGITVVGYGSDAYLALKEALNVGTAINVVGEETIPAAGYNNYSWIDTIFGLGTIQTQGASTPSDWTDDVYAYWSQYDGTSTNLSSFVLGSYSSISSAPLTQSVFTMTYAEVAM
ncbi:hypothetical protein [Candidatus Methanomassiliicoccus intestinalis]|uniref:hypothetical protein n=1 Tax=Candidatus Methanomassiliicoccus intestinalis TaxID=1406512 RepID=UPI0037DD5494